MAFALEMNIDKTEMTVQAKQKQKSMPRIVYERNITGEGLAFQENQALTISCQRLNKFTKKIIEETSIISYMFRNYKSQMTTQTML